MKLKIISGSLGGRQFNAPRGKRTHPMSEKMRGAIFNIIGDITELTVLDAFAGSGALSFEALSRGAQHATAIEIDKDAYQVIQKNAQALGISNIKITRANVSSWLDNNLEKKFDLIFCDPPYDNIQLKILQKLTNYLKQNGIMVVSCPKEIALKNVVKVQSKNYGDSQLVFYRQN